MADALWAERGAHWGEHANRTCDSVGGAALSLPPFLYLAATGHIVDLVGIVLVLAFPAIEFVPLPVEGEQQVAAAPAVEHVLAQVSLQMFVVVGTPVDLIVTGPPSTLSSPPKAYTSSSPSPSASLSFSPVP